MEPSSSGSWQYDVSTPVSGLYRKMPEFTVAIHDLGDSSINIRFRGYVKSGSYDKFLKVRGEFLGQVIEKYRQADIDFAFPTSSVYLENGNTKIEN